MTATFPITDSALHLIGPGPISCWTKQERFWEERGRPQLTTGQILSVFGYSTTWDYQERHPDGEELALVLDGSIDFLLDDGAGERPVRILKGFGCVVPTGIWHRVAPVRPSTILFITPVPARTEHRTAQVPATPG